MSYKLTEAERKHIATIEDTRIWISGNLEGGIPAYDIYISDDDKLNGLIDSKFHIRLPKYKFQWDDDIAKLHLIDVSNAPIELEITTDGLNNFGIGWRYTLSTEKINGTEYVTALKFMRDNDNKTYFLDLSHLGPTTIQSLVVDETARISGELTVDSPVYFNDTLTVSGKTLLEENLEVHGTSEFMSGVKLNKDLTVFGEAQFKDKVSIDKGLTVASSGIAVTGDSLITGELTINGNLIGKGTASFSKKVTARKFDALSGITAGTDITAGNNITAKNDLIVENSAYIFGNLIIKKILEYLVI
jgi:hypothetical protein